MAAPTLLPPIEGVPILIRPRCAWCDKPVPILSKKTLEPTAPHRTLRREFICYKGYGRVNGIPRFDTLRCAASFALAAHQAGYRRTT